MTSFAAGRPGPVVVVRRSVVLLLAVMALGAIHFRHRPATFCLLRSLTGAPCPFCGGTTALVHLGTGDFRGAVGASPLALLMVTLAPVAGVVKGPWQARPALMRALVVVLALASEVWQLHRFGFI